MSISSTKIKNKGDKGIMSFLPKVGRIDRSKEVPPIRLLMYAPAGFGKTYFASKWPDAIHLNTDGNIAYTDLPGFTINMWETPANYIAPTEDEIKRGAVDLRQHSFTNVVEELIKNNGGGFKTIIVDLVEHVYQLARRSKLEEFGLTHESDLPNGGKGYDIVRTPFFATMNRLMSLPVNIILLTHEKEKTIKDRIGREFTFFQPNLDDAVLKKMSGYGYTLRGYMKPVSIDGNESSRVVRMLSLSPKADEFQVTRFIDAKGNPIVLDDIELTYDNFYNVIKNVKDPENIGTFKLADSIDTGKTGKEKVADKKGPSKTVTKPLPSKTKDLVVEDEPAFTQKDVEDVKKELGIDEPVVETKPKTDEPAKTVPSSTIGSIDEEKRKRLAELKASYLKKK